MDLYAIEEPSRVYATDAVEENKPNKFSINKIKNCAIFLTNLLPMSMRGLPLGVPINLLKVPVRVVQSAVQASVNENNSFTDKLTRYLKRDFCGGITDFPTYVRFSEKAAALAQENLVYAQLVYSNSRDGKFPSLCNPWNHRDDLDKKPFNEIKNLGFKRDASTGIFYCEDTGTCFTLAIKWDPENKKSEIVACFYGLGRDSLREGNCDDLTAAHAWDTAITDFVGFVNQGAIQAMNLGHVLKRYAKENSTDIKDVKLVGHSHGGGLAQTAALANGLKAVVFNSRPIGVGVRRYIGQGKVAKNAEKIIAFSSCGDYLSSFTTVNVVAKLIERFTGIMLPRTAAKEYEVPNILQDPFDRNAFNEANYFEKRLINHVAFDQHLASCSSKEDSKEDFFFS